MTEKRQLLNKKEILKNLSNLNKESLIDLTIFKVIGSTNDEAKKKLDKVQNFDDCFAIFAEKQDAGRGRRGKKWESPANLNIYLSFAWNSSLKPTELEGLSLCTAVAISQDLKPLLNEELKIKWPNGTYLGSPDAAHAGPQTPGLLQKPPKGPNGTQKKIDLAKTGFVTRQIGRGTGSAGVRKHRKHTHGSN
mgnify:CR=1 FL=1